jgi:hypothetical protein
MSTPTTEAQTDEIETIVSFAAAHEQFRKPYPPATTATTVLTDALRVFEITSDGTTRYYLLLDGHEVGPDETVGELASRHEHGPDHEHRALKLKLRTETISG